MILAHDKSWLFVSTMKCATHSLYAALAPLGERLRPEFIHPIPAKRLAPMQWTVCRNPYDRAVSIWASTALRDEGDKYLVRKMMSERGGDYTSFKDFCSLILMRDPKPRVPHLFEPQHVWHGKFDHDRVVHLENLETEVRDIVGPIQYIPKQNRSERAESEQYMTPEIAEIIEQWAGEDFERYGYPKWQSQTSQS